MLLTSFSDVSVNFKQWRSITAIDKVLRYLPYLCCMRMLNWIHAFKIVPNKPVYKFEQFNFKVFICAPFLKDKNVCCLSQKLYRILLENFSHCFLGGANFVCKRYMVKQNSAPGLKDRSIVQVCMCTTDHASYKPRLACMGWHFTLSRRLLFKC